MIEFAPCRSETPFRRRVGYFASAPSAMSAQLEHLFQSGPRMVWTRSMSIVADAADDADGVTGSGLTNGRYRDCPRSQPTLVAEDNLNSEGAEVCARRSRLESARELMADRAQWALARPRFAKKLVLQPRIRRTFGISLHQKGSLRRNWVRRGPGITRRMAPH